MIEYKLILLVNHTLNTSKANEKLKQLKEKENSGTEKFLIQKLSTSKKSEHRESWFLTTLNIRAIPAQSKKINQNHFPL